MKTSELRRRVERYLRGDCREVDLDRIFLGLRERSGGRASIREIGDFVAHRNQREKGPVTDKIRDIQLSLVSWLNQVKGQCPDLPVAKRIAAANLRTATDAQLNTNLGLRREVAKSVLAQVIKKLEAGRHEKITEREKKTFNYLAGSFIWNPAFTDEQVAEDLASLLIKFNVLTQDERVAFDTNRSFLALYITALMHGSAVVMEDGTRFDLVAGFDNTQQHIEVKARIELNMDGWGKKIIAPICVFWTNLIGISHCTETLIANPSGWTGVIELNAEHKLTNLA